MKIKEQNIARKEKGEINMRHQGSNYEKPIERMIEIIKDSKNSEI